jgi:hypothetical protein
MESRDNRKYTGEMYRLEPSSTPLNKPLIAGIGTDVAVAIRHCRCLCVFKISATGSMTMRVGMSVWQSACVAFRPVWDSTDNAKRIFIKIDYICYD